MAAWNEPFEGATSGALPQPLATGVSTLNDKILLAALATCAPAPLEPAQAMESWLVTPWVAFKMGACRLAWAEDAKDPGPKGDRATLWPKSGCRRVEAAPNKFGVVARAAFDVPKPDSAPESS